MIKNGRRVFVFVLRLEEDRSEEQEESLISFVLSSKYNDENGTTQLCNYYYYFATSTKMQCTHTTIGGIPLIHLSCVAHLIFLNIRREDVVENLLLP